MMPNDLDSELRDTLSTIVEEHAVSDVADPVAAIEQRVGRRHRNRLLLVGSGIAAMIVFVVVVAAAISARDDGNKPRVVVSPSTTIPEPLLTNPVETMPKPPLAVRGDAAVVWTGRDLVVWGGDVEAFNMGLPGKDRSYADGAVFDPRTRGWRAINPKTPLPNTFDTPVGVATEDGVVFARGKHMARWIADDDVWIPYPDAAAPIQDLARSGDLLMSYSANAVFDLDAARWSSLPTPPLALERAATVSTGSELIVVGGPGTPFTDAAGLALDPAAKQWRKLAPFPRGMHAEALAADWDGRRVVVANYDMKAATYDPRADRWTTLPEVPARFSEWYPTARSTGGRTAVFMAAAMVVLDGNRWTPLPAPTASLGTVATTRPGFGSQADNGVLFVFGFQDDENVLTAIDLDA
ncbi:MAG TPA: hypothetical protein VFX21_12690, partial [Acidimicrobiia bacterium]|nr:hypothetical protein [Acidimicrobiia bacterium]